MNFQATMSGKIQINLGLTWISNIKFLELNFSEGYAKKLNLKFSEVPLSALTVARSMVKIYWDTTTTTTINVTVTVTTTTAIATLIIVVVGR